MEKTCLKIKNSLDKIKTVITKKLCAGFPLWMVILAVLAAGCIWYHKSRPYHFKVVEPGILYRSGWMTPDDEDEMIRKYGIRTVVNLCLPNESMYLENYRDEQQICHSNNVNIVYIPMAGNTPPTLEQTDQWLNLLKDRQQQPILVHCAQGATRTAVMVAVYQMEFLGKENRQTLNNLETFGHELTVPKRKDIYDFIAHYEPAS